MLLVVAVWLAIGATASIVMGRRGHRPFTWGVLGAALGPLVVPLARADMQREREAEPVTLATGSPGRGEVDVIVGVDGSRDAQAALDTIVDLLGERIGRCALATVIDFDSAATAQAGPARERAQQSLASEARRLRDRAGREAEQVVLPGRPADALARYAASSGYHLLVVGSRGHGASTRILGSVATALASGAPVPVFVVTAPPENRAEHGAAR